MLEYFSDLERKTADARYVFRGYPYGFICIHLNDVEALEINQPHYPAPHLAGAVFLCYNLINGGVFRAEL